MQVIWRPDSLINGQLGKQLLRANGIHAHLAGEHLSGGLGDLPAFGLYALMVEPAQAMAALDLLRECGLVDADDAFEA